MMLPEVLPGRPTSRAHRRFRLIIAFFLVLILVLLLLQYTTWHLLPEGKTSTLWGALVGMTVMTAYAEWRWSKRRGED